MSAPKSMGEYLALPEAEKMRLAALPPVRSEPLLADAVELLVEIEWGCTVSAGTCTVKICPVCCGWHPRSGDGAFWSGREDRRGHMHDCRLAAFLRAANTTAHLPPASGGKVPPVVGTLDRWKP